MRYFILTYYRKADGRLDESMEVSRRLRTRDVTQANIILDFKTLKVEKAVLDGTVLPPNFNRIVEYYYEHYKNIMDRLFRENGWEVEKNENKASVDQSTEHDPG